MLPNEVAVAAAQGLNANPALVDTVLKSAEPSVIANILNSGAADNLIAGLIPLLSHDVAKSIAEGVNDDAADLNASTSMVRSLILSTNPDVHGRGGKRERGLRLRTPGQPLAQRGLRP